jgi:hypothetical protein
MGMRAELVEAPTDGKCALSLSKRRPAPFDRLRAHAPVSERAARRSAAERALASEAIEHTGLRHALC